jgi:hypothetical protein
LIYTAHDHGARVYIYTASRDASQCDDALYVASDGRICNAIWADTEACTLVVYVMDKLPNGTRRIKIDQEKILTATVKASYDIVDRASGQVIDRACL